MTEKEEYNKKLRIFVKRNPEFQIHKNSRLYCNVCAFYCTRMSDINNIKIDWYRHNRLAKQHYCKKIMKSIGYEYYIDDIEQPNFEVICTKGHIWKTNIFKFTHLNRADKCKKCASINE